MVVAVKWALDWTWNSERGKEGRKARVFPIQRGPEFRKSSSLLLGDVGLQDREVEWRWGGVGISK